MDMSEGFWLRIWQSIIAGVCILGLTMGACDSYQRKLFVDGGYHACAIVGDRGTAWCK